MKPGNEHQMERIKFSRDEMAAIVRDIQDYFREELESEIGNIPAEMLLDFFSEQIGGYYYNRGLYDAQAILQKKLDDINDAIFEIERPAVKR